MDKEVLDAAVASGFVTIRICKIARLAGVSESTVRLFLRGTKIRAENENSIRKALGLPASVSRE